ncbi:MAG: hypothetical protein KUA35_16585 [Pseudodesulfovibrio sp.]|uniref:Uncharacterized protein n=1 Tax=Pseudodesulfovibrio aespoeensis (strain ATCC 700646 / DSM 10631 / Aspo-2) TaxID=643562 RepID=E6VW53_PSEA9|nr:MULTISPECIES: hypothetical protein [Pseudodesulfovibrio]MBU4191666.1 hypothetical protein [Pseudomonadota bacterium]ADU63613.1 hypothetical protein Daes_2615 [Pseudodesulfovibrio aespoeensis Aspo-2]MBU4243228.1 hypothetical protein [Pseudomonadota bacterium]MBU4379962.1 hypothetical protein [Pseudomonadota bacterium]MBU4475497.1 hypothetical protein [Pseudomonadota bacterium]
MQLFVTKSGLRGILQAMILAAALCMPALVNAQDTAPLSTDDLVSLVGRAVVEDAAQADERVRKAQAVYDEVRRGGTPEQQRTANRDLEQAREQCRYAEQKLDTARVEGIARKSGRSPAEIQSMRASGMGWGAIANETGVHPSVNAKGNAKSSGKGKGKSADDTMGTDTGKSKAKGKGKQ